MRVRTRAGASALKDMGGKETLFSSAKRARLQWPTGKCSLDGLPNQG